MGCVRANWAVCVCMSLWAVCVCASLCVWAVCVCMRCSVLQCVLQCLLRCVLQTLHSRLLSSSVFSWVVMGCSMLQRVALRCSMLQRVATWYDVCYSVYFRFTATHCNTLQHTLYSSHQPSSFHPPLPILLLLPQCGEIRVNFTKIFFHSSLHPPADRVV